LRDHTDNDQSTATMNRPCIFLSLALRRPSRTHDLITLPNQRPETVRTRNRLGAGHAQAKNLTGANYSQQILEDAYNLDPGHPLTLLALSVFETHPESKSLRKRRSFPRSENDARLAAGAAETLLINKNPDNARKAAKLALKLPKAMDADRAKAQAGIENIQKGQHDR
jgi:hypothetical protein